MAMNPWDAVDDPRRAICVDCEMIMCEGSKQPTLARVAILDVHDESVLLDAYAASPAPVVDYLTRYSGIRAKDLEGAPPFDEVRRKVVELVNGRPLVGHGISSDLRALRLEHPPELVVDTQDLEWGAGQRKGLKFLSLDMLGEAIQRT